MGAKRSDARRGSIAPGGLGAAGGGSASSMSRRKSLANALQMPGAGGGAGAVTTDEMLFGSRRGGAAHVQPDVAASSRDWTGLPEDVATAILAADTGERQEKLLDVMEATTRDFELYLQSRPEGWEKKLVELNGVERVYSAADARAFKQALADESYLANHDATATSYPAAPAVGGRQVGRHVGRRLTGAGCDEAVFWPKARPRSPAPLPPSMASCPEASGLRDFDDPLLAPPPLPPPPRPRSAADAASSAHRTPLVPLASVLAALAGIENLASGAETAATARRARQHALQQHRQLGGVRPELYEAVEAIHRGVTSPQEHARQQQEQQEQAQQQQQRQQQAMVASAEAASQGRGSRSDVHQTKPSIASAMPPQPQSARDAAVRRVGSLGNDGSAMARRPLTARAAYHHPLPPASPRGASASASRGGGARGPSVLLARHGAPEPERPALINPMVALATRKDLKEVAGKRAPEKLSADQAERLTRWRFNAIGDQHAQATLR